MAPPSAPKIRLNDRVIASEVDGEFSLYDPRSEDVHILNHTASDIWGLIDGEHSVDEIVELLALAYEKESALIRPDVERTVSTWVQEGLVLIPTDTDHG